MPSFCSYEKTFELNKYFYYLQGRNHCITISIDKFCNNRPHDQKSIDGKGVYFKLITVMEYKIPC